MWRLGIVIISIVAAYSSLRAQGDKPELVVKGKIAEKATGQPLEYANIAVYSAKDSALVTGTITGIGGYFTIQVPKPGKYYAVADFMGYDQLRTGAFALDMAHQTHQLGVLGLTQDAIGLAEVEVVSDRPAVSYKIDRKVIDVSGNAAVQGGTAIDALESLPSISTEVDGSVSLRGSTNFTVLIDGRQSPLAGSDALSQIPASSISKIELITNPSAKYDPDGTSGIINIITKKGSMRGHSVVANASAGTSPSGSADVAYTYRAQRYSLSVSLGGRKSENAFSADNDRSYFAPFSSATASMQTDQEGQRMRSNYFARAGVDLFVSPSNTLSVGAGVDMMEFGRGYDAHTGIIDTLGQYQHLATSQNFASSPFLQRYSIGDKQLFGDNDNHYLQSEISYQTSQRGKNDQAVQYLPGTAEAAEDNESSTAEESHSINGEINYSHPLSEKHTGEMGAVVRSDRYLQAYERWSNAGAGSSYTDTARFERYIVGVYLLGKGEIRGLQYSAGVRAENTDQSIKTVRQGWDIPYRYLGWYPSLSLTRPLSETSTLQASYSRRINRPRDFHTNPFPNLSDGYMLMTPNPYLQPEYATSLELNYQKTKGPHQLTAETFYRYTDNKMTRVSDLRGDTVVYTFVNIGSETDAGMELTATLKLAKWYSLQPTYTLSWNKVEGQYRGSQRIASSAVSRANITQTFGLGRFTKLQFMAYYNGRKKTIEGETLPTAWCSASVRREFLDRALSVSLRAEDLLASRTQESYTYTDASELHSLNTRDGRTFVLAVSYRFNAQGKRARDSQKTPNGDNGDMDF